MLAVMKTQISLMIAILACTIRSGFAVPASISLLCPPSCDAFASLDHVSEG